MAASLGRKLGLVRLQGVIAVTLLTGAAVAVIGPVVFIGLVVPHIARVLAQLAGVGPDHRWLLPLSAVLAPCLLLAADIVGRLIARPDRDPGGHPRRLHRRPVLHRAGPPPTPRGAVT